jgi:hypothetical protein
MAGRFVLSMAEIKKYKGGVDFSGVPYFRKISHLIQKLFVKTYTGKKYIISTSLWMRKCRFKVSRREVWMEQC